MTPRHDLVDTMAGGAVSDTRVEIKLYRYETKASVPKAWLLSPGKRADAQFVPKSLCTEPSAEKIVKLGNDDAHEGVWRVEAWKLRELGWSAVADERQGEMFS